MNQSNPSDTTVLVVSQRLRSDGFGRQPGYIAFIEAEDVLASTCDVDIAMIAESPRHPLIRGRRFGGRQLRRLTGSTNPLPLLPSPRPQAPLPRDHYDVAIFVGFTIWDLPLLERMTSVRSHADKIIAWFPEAWISEFDDERVRYESLGLLDAMYVGMETACLELQTLADCPVRHLPPAVDVPRFASLSPEERRPIDVLNIGRRDPRLHRAVLDWSRKSNKLYVYDTIAGTTVPDAEAHRSNLGDTYRQTDIAITNFAKYDLPEIVRGDREIPGRLWEGLASGSIMMGNPPEERLQKELVGEIVVTELPEEPSEAIDIITELQARDHTDQRRAQIQLAMRRHDWAHRWSEIFTTSGLEPPSGLKVRLDRLDAMADSLERPRA